MTNMRLPTMIMDGNQTKFNLIKKCNALASDYL